MPHISLKKPADKAGMDAARMWATAEDKEDIVEAMRVDEHDVMHGCTGEKFDSIVEKNNTGSGSGSEDGDYESRGVRWHRCTAVLSASFVASRFPRELCGVVTMTKANTIYLPTLPNQRGRKTSGILESRSA